MTNVLWVAAGLLLVVGLGLLVWPRLRGAKRVTEDQHVEAVRMKRKMESLLGSDGWKMLAEMLEAQIGPRKQRVLYAPTKEPMEQEYTKGEIAMLEMIARLPRTIIATSDEVIQSYMEQMGGSPQGDE